MNHTLPNSATAQSKAWTLASAKSVAQDATRRIAPLWPLRHFVAVNPFLGLSDRSFPGAAELLSRVAPGGLRMDLAYYREKYEAGEITDADLQAAIARGGEVLGEPATRFHPAELLVAVAWQRSADADATLAEALTLAEVLDRRNGTSWNDALTESVAGFCSAYFDAGQSAWGLPWRNEPFYPAWKKFASVDRKLEMLGLKGLRTQVRCLPDDPYEAIADALTRLRVDESAAPDYLHRLMLSIRGWAGYVQYLVRETSMRGGEDDLLFQLLAIRLSLDASLTTLTTEAELGDLWPPVEAPTDDLSQPTVIRYLWQLAHEHAWETRVSMALTAKLGSTRPTLAVRPDVQAVFCIDVRSEVFRRALEASSPRIQTRGFAGFFGLAIEYRPMDLEKGQAQCPVLLTPQFTVHECLHEPSNDAQRRRQLAIGKRVAHGWNAFKSSAISCFSFVETAGLLFGGSLLRDEFLPPSGKPKHACQGSGPSLDFAGGIPQEKRTGLAFGMLKNMGLTSGFARIILLCGHGSETTNNPYASGLDCGACGGHAGDANARVGAALLNDPGVRTALAQTHGIVIPDDTWFLAGLHNTTTDDVVLFDADRLPATHAEDIKALRQNLDHAGAASRQERSALLGLPASTTGPQLDRKVRSRAHDWSQVRPEWGLAGNAAFVAAPRARTAEANLGGRVFLHEYDHHSDRDGSILELIMTAPMVVANWINLQYYASTVNNAVFGSGNKVIHNVVGTLGVCLGNSGDLQTGLPLQSVHDGSKFIHEPLRLHVFLEAPIASIDTVLAKHSQVRELVDNGWLLLFSIDDRGALHRYAGKGVWKAGFAP
jgi:uncharacterized protein YbcC (UPF0753/DUF2309 family)